MKNYIEELVQRYPVLLSSQNDIEQSYRIMKNCYEHGGKLLIAGNGGSAADSEHIVGELMKCFSLPRPLNQEFSDKLRGIDEKMGAELAGKLQKALPAIALSGHTGLSTAFANDVDGNMGFAQQVLGYGASQDVLLAISTSGDSANIIYAAITAKAKDMMVVLLTGNSGGRAAKFADVEIKVTETEVYRVQELHLPVYHCLCHMLEDHFFNTQYQENTK